MSQNKPMECKLRAHLGFGFRSRVEGLGSRVEGSGLRVYNVKPKNPFCENTANSTHPPPTKRIVD